MRKTPLKTIKIKDTDWNGPAEEIEKIIPLELNPDFGRQDLNHAVGKLQEKINEIIKKLN